MIVQEKIVVNQFISNSLDGVDYKDFDKIKQWFHKNNISIIEFIIKTDYDNHHYCDIDSLIIEYDNNIHNSFSIPIILKEFDIQYHKHINCYSLLECGCMCVHQKILYKHPHNKSDFSKGNISEVVGYGCLHPLFNNKMIFFDDNHCMCELFYDKNKFNNRLKLLVSMSQNKCCKLCSYPIIVEDYNYTYHVNPSRDAIPRDYLYYCSNKYCINHIGKEIDVNDNLPEFIMEKSHGII